VNAETAVPAVRVRCPACRSQIAIVWLVRNYHHSELVFTARGEETRVLSPFDGLVVTAEWCDTGKREPGAPPHPVEWPVVPSAQLFTYCRRHGSFVLDHDEVRSWETQFMQKKTTLTRVARAAQRFATP
jgi:hypothetical protein